MIASSCVFTIVRLQAQYRGNPYDLDECEGCGTMRLATDPEQERRNHLPRLAECNDVLGFVQFLIESAKEPAELAAHS
jgi:hypothetical protein